MIHKTFTEGIRLQEEGPKSSTFITSTCISSAEKSYRTAINLVPKLVPKRTQYVMDGVLSKAPSATYNRSCSLSNGDKYYGSSISLDQNSPEETEMEDNFPFYQSIELVPGLVMKDYSETINNFPRERSYLYNTTFAYDPSYIKEHYIVGLEIDKVREVAFELPEDEFSFFESSLHVIIPEDKDCEKGVVNGECEAASVINGA